MSILPETQAALLLTEPLFIGDDRELRDLLTGEEYRALVRYLSRLGKSTADLVSRDSEGLIEQCASIIDGSRMNYLLGRGFQMSFAIEKWQSRSIWVLGSTDVEYPQRLKDYLGDDAPVVLYGCGNKELLNRGGLAIVGPDHSVTEPARDYVEQMSVLLSRSQRPAVSIGDNGFGDLVRSSVSEGTGVMTSVTSASLLKASIIRENRNLLMKGQMLLLSPCDPSIEADAAGFEKHNRLMYALADAVLVLASENAEQEERTTNLEPLNVLESMRFYVHSVGGASSTAKALKEKGASDWPEPQEAEELGRLLDEAADARMRPETDWADSLARLARRGFGWFRGLFGRQGDDG